MRAVDPRPGETVVVSAAAGGVGVLTVQLARRTGATVVGIASEANHDWLRAHGVVPVAHGDGLVDRIRAAAPDGVDAFIDLFGDGYVDAALELGVRAGPHRHDHRLRRGREARVKADGNAVGARPEVLAELAALLAKGELELPVAATYPLEQVQTPTASWNAATPAARSSSSRNRGASGAGPGTIASVSGRVESVAVAVVRTDPWTRVKSGRSGIDKRPVDGPVRLTASGVDGDTICDVAHHGGPTRPSTPTRPTTSPGGARSWAGRSRPSGRTSRSRASTARAR